MQTVTGKKKKKRMDKHNENINKKIKNVRKYEAEVTDLKNIISELKIC